MSWYWCIAQAGYEGKTIIYHFEAESDEDALEKATEWWKQENGGLKSDYFAVARETHFHGRKINPRPFRQRRKYQNNQPPAHS